jgi:hypothetical protein
MRNLLTKVTFSTSKSRYIDIPLESSEDSDELTVLECSLW